MHTTHSNIPTTNGNGFRRVDRNGDLRQTQAARYGGPINDCHFHYTDFRNRHTSFANLGQIMEANGVSGMVNFEMQIKQLWQEGRREPKYYRDTYSKCEWNTAADVRMFFDHAQLAEGRQNQHALFICGFNPCDRDCVRYVEDKLEAYGDQVVGIGEVLLGHGELTNKLRGEDHVRPNHPALDPVLKLAGEQRLPVLIHHDLRLETSKKLDGLDELVATLDKHEETIFIYAHCGINRGIRVEGLEGILKGQLNRFPNLFMDLSWEEMWNIVFDSKTSLFRSKFIELIEEYPDRFVIGSDAVGQQGVEDYPRLVAKMRCMLGQLSPETAKKVAFKNIERLLPTRFRTSIRLRD